MWRSPSSPQIHQKYIYMWNNSYRTRIQERVPCNWVGWEKYHLVVTCAPGKDLRGKERLHRQTLALGSEGIKPQTGCPRPGSDVEEISTSYLPLAAGRTIGTDRKAGEA